MPSIIVAGHLCLDIIPRFKGGDLNLLPGALTTVGAPVFATGGAVSNVGLALLKLGVDTALMGKVGQDAFGDEVRRIIARQSATAASSILTSETDATSYTLVLNPPGVDRHFLHHPGCNDTFSAEDIDLERVKAAQLFYLGYPPLMKQMYTSGGAALASLFKQVRALDVATALDMTLPDPNAPSGQIDWRLFLDNVLPHTDIFLPSLPETVFMLRPKLFSTPSWESDVSLELLRDLTDQIIRRGVAVAGLKLGAEGFYVRTASAERLRDTAGLELGEAWSDRELFSPSFVAGARGTVGAGDAAYAGFLAALVRGDAPETCLTMACAVGACSVEAYDATGGVKTWDETVARLAAGWNSRALTGKFRGWQLESGRVYSS